MSDNRKVEILLRIARDIATEARDIFRIGAGQPMDPSDSFYDEPGLIDDIETDTPEYEWVNQVLSFSRFVYHILQYAIAIEGEDRMIENGEDEF